MCHHQPGQDERSPEEEVMEEEEEEEEEEEVGGSEVCFFLMWEAQVNTGVIWSSGVLVGGYTALHPFSLSKSIPH